MERFSGYNPDHVAAARRIGWEWAAAYIIIDKTRDVENVGCGFGWDDQDGDDLLNEAFDAGLADALANMTDDEARAIIAAEDAREAAYVA